jgi:hypothetical protein
MRRRSWMYQLGWWLPRQASCRQVPGWIWQTWCAIAERVHSGRREEGRIEGLEGLEGKRGYDALQDRH